MAFKSKKERERSHMQLLERLQGNGTVTTRNGEQKLVQYNIYIYAEEINAGTQENPNATIPGTRDLRGRVEPICFFNDKELTLTMQDGRNLHFCFTDKQGSIH